ncbi:hypothetical protein GSI_01598 [Ganoderma sinense ZZ0214-1]|uniref:Sey1/RHD3-like three-helix bundle domain-containing protein n=1 Tax=Ganoderma sinense ZZ0214-1 TaxID=1077348 RepID=A0A2G8SQT7_9APHY|nr:hypothetical protein GSI_01598 [Ganoderma sinense ZZ0214-1]
MWDKVLTVFRETLEKAESSYLTKAKSFDCTDEENSTALAILRRRAWLALRAKVDEQTAETIFLGKLRNYFEERFRYDEKGTPRVWKPDDDIDSAFRKAKEQTLELIPIYWRIEPLDPSLKFTLPSETSDPLTSTEEFDFPATLIVFSETKSLDLNNRFRKDADAYYVEAKRSMVSSVAQIPYWMYGVLVVLGWNEAMLVLFNPLYFTMLLILLVSAYVIVQLGMTGPVLQILKSLGGEVHRQVEGRLREHFSQPQITQPVRASQPRNSTSVDEPEKEIRRRKAEPY